MGLELINVMATGSDLIGRVGQHYVSAVLAEVYKVVFASDILGNPVAVVGALGTGVRDFFVEPAQGLVQSPAAFGRGLIKGTGSLMKNTVVGLGVGVSSLTSSVSRGVATLTFDSDYLRERAERAARRVQNRPTHLAAGLLQGGRELGRGIAQGIAGVVLDPLKGAEADGASGFVKGVGRGIAGLVVKPVAGLLDMASRTSEGIVASAKSAGGDKSNRDMISRKRHQRLLWGIDRVVIASDALHATIVSILRKALEVAARETTASAAATAGSSVAASTAGASHGAGAECKGQGQEDAKQR
jgi:vacuolar protein sorting-associated protein 13A/C